MACERMKTAGAKRALVLPVGGAFHSPTCAVYQNVSARAVMDKDEIKQNLIAQLTSPVRWTQSVQAMIYAGASRFTESGPGKVLQGLILKISKEATVQGIN